MLEEIEKHYLRKLLGTLKYSELDPYEMNELAFNPIINTIIEKLKDSRLEQYSENFHQRNPNVKKFCFEFENHVGIAIRERLNYLSDSLFHVISKWNTEEMENYVGGLLGSISCEKSEFNKLVEFLRDLSKQRASR